MKNSALLALAAASFALALPASAQFAKPEDAVKYRQSAMFIQNQHLGRVAAMASGRVPYDAAAATANAEVVAMISKLPWAGFGPGTEGGKAKPDIWKEQAKFKELNERLMAETEKLAAATKAGNLDAVKAAVSSVGETCKTCHDTFRSR
ncbi:c-type cytochrome [Variovorax ginsengisoli]|uniref:Cytochrome c n=1 Tax=Variovorax ginsengisoli TaxID=363844 RepID=A0ABT8S034_9BURK|nr:cytochrome c [Variovorax ginsengisoli]MDN8613115.1 cytochrome c [Variovorax ginsengisoli]MDO1532285.1 cytochrome c [Variovorax ginsengisoli]